MRKAFYVLNQYSEQRQIERNKLFKIQNSVAFDLVKNTFYMWVKKYQYRVTRRPMLLKALNFWAENTLSKSMRSWKVYKATMTEERKKYRTFWVIRGAVWILDNSSIYDKIAYPSQALNLPIKHYDVFELEKTVETYHHQYLKRMFASWKEFYFKVRNHKGKMAFQSVSKMFSHLRQNAVERKLNRRKVSQSIEKVNSNRVSHMFDPIDS